MSDTKDENKTISNDVPEIAQDLTIFVQNLLDQMVINSDIFCILILNK